MTEQPENAEAVDSSVYLTDGEVVIFDPDYLDKNCEAQGVLGMQYTVDRGLWTLIGRGEGGAYAQAWEQVAPDKAKQRPALKPV